MLENIEALIFDLDGTLVDSMGVWVAIDKEFLAKYGLTQPDYFHEGMEGMSYSETAQYFLDLFPELKQTKEELMEEWQEMAYQKYKNEVPLKPGAKELLLAAKDRGIKIGIATSNSRELAQLVLESQGIWELISSMWTSCEAKAGKPAPDVYLKVAEALEVAPENCLIFEDVPNGILAGINAGMKTCAVEDEFSKPYEAKKRELADYYIRDYNDINNNTYEVLK